MAKAAATVHLQDFADDHGVTIRTITNWLAEGMPHRTVRGERRVVRKEANAWLLERTRRKEAEKSLGSRWDKDVEQAKKISIERQIKELDLAKRRGALLEVDEFDAFADRLIGGFSSVVSGQLQPFERRMGLSPEDARALTLEMQVALMRGAQQMADALDAEAEEIARAQSEETEPEIAVDEAAIEEDEEDTGEELSLPLTYPGDMEVAGA